MSGWVDFSWNNGWLLVFAIPYVPCLFLIVSFLVYSNLDLQPSVLRWVDEFFFFFCGIMDDFWFMQFHMFPAFWLCFFFAVLSILFSLIDNLITIYLLSEANITFRCVPITLSGGSFCHQGCRESLV